MPRYPFPPLPETRRPFPPADPLDTTLAEMSDLWIEPQCACGPSCVQMPLRLMAAEQGWNVTLRQVVEHMSCRKCGKRPVLIDITDDPQAGAAGNPYSDRRAITVKISAATPCPGAS